MRENVYFPLRCAALTSAGAEGFVCLSIFIYMTEKIDASMLEEFTGG